MSSKLMDKILRSIARILQIEKYVVFNSELEKWKNSIEDYEKFEGLSIVNVDSQNIGDVQKFRGKSILPRFRRFYANGCYGVYAYLWGTVIGHAWMEVNRTQAHKLGQEGVLLLPGEGGIWCENVSDKYRGKRVINFLLNQLYEKARFLDCQKLITHVLKDNEASIRAHKRFLGKDFTGSATILKIMFLVVIYKSYDRWFAFLRLLGLEKGISVAWSESGGFSLLLV